MHASLKSNMTNYINVAVDKNIILATFSFTNSQDQTNRQITEGCSIEFIRYQMPWKDQNSRTALLTGINQQNCVRHFVILIG